jgi:hypothetical protein
MGSKIAIGLVYGKELFHVKIDILNSILKSLVDDKGILNYKYSIDEFGEKWIDSKEVTEVLSLDTLGKVISGYYAEIALNTAEFSQVSKSIVIRLENEEEYFGVLIELEESDVKAIGYDTVEKLVIKFLESEFDKFNYAYAFCDAEGEIELSPNEVSENNTELFSILLVSEKGNVKTTKSSWKIDGTSKRESEVDK